MTIVFGEIDATRPQTHACVIAVGAYHHLAGGDAAPMAIDMPLGQLGSPVPSALALVDWLRTKFANPDAPLGSIDLITSPCVEAKTANGDVTVEEATIAAILRACAAWFERCDAHPQNVALFYFCGHGVMRANTALLASDFGESPLNPFMQALDVDKLRLGMGRCKASTQLYFVDACRQMPYWVKEQLDLDAQVPIPPQLTAPQRSDHVVLMSAAPLERAYGVATQPSRFTRALIASLEGRAARRIAGRWQVSTADLGFAVTRTVDRLVRMEQAQPQTVSPGGSPRGARVHVCPTAPTVPLDIAVSPNAAAACVSVRLVKPNGDVVWTRPRGPEQPWSAEIVVGSYQLSGTFDPADGFTDAANPDVLVLPPEAAESLQVT